MGLHWIYHTRFRLLLQRISLSFRLKFHALDCFVLHALYCYIAIVDTYSLLLLLFSLVCSLKQHIIR